MRGSGVVEREDVKELPQPGQEKGTKKRREEKTPGTRVEECMFHFRTPLNGHLSTKILLRAIFKYCVG